ncbi:mechanosensitive ion channel family protein [Mangrovivirga cuniculi]|uniref:Mechanosensitive ion channel protein MscS n=1 Tax=Mangrovivirga cuniculi TaxID=2715131 RepID=A0A4D7JHG9_9BACT|nr:mechanosensitive ion channel domain-containing protein [Mangrovivirga cuniculi]QCK15061.1 mechanosensitive ion channel protein MscS [Mangrovivirga cuniculi]
MDFKEILDKLGEIFKPVIDILSYPVFNLGKTEFTLITILSLILSFVALVYISNLIRKLLVTKVMARYNIEYGIRQTYGYIFRLFVLTVGTLIILNSFGINFTTLGIVVGALGVGIGFGLQTIVDNIVSGMIILFDQPIKVGDRVEVGEIVGDIIKIGGRATTIRTNDNIIVIVPNSEFISKMVINWSHNDRRIRIKVPLGVSYKEDPERVRRIVLEVANKNDNVLSNPEPFLLFTEYGNSSIDFTLLVWSTKYVDRPAFLQSELYYAIFQRFREENIEIPFPQRDINFRNELEIKKDGEQQ